MIVTNDKGRSFLIRVIRCGEMYGLNDCVRHDRAGAMIEFFDLSYPEKFGERGQFVSRYYACTLAEKADGTGIALDCGIPCWSIDGEALRPVLVLARDLVGEAALKVVSQ